MKKSKTVQFCQKNKLCCSCGLCADICPKKAIKIIEKNGIFVPTVNKNLCVNCGLCFKICSGKGNNWFEQSKNLQIQNEEKSNFSEQVGFFRKSFISHSTNSEIRFSCASGGTVSSILIFLLEKGFINGAIVTRFKKNSPLEVETVIATTKEEILEAKSSKYCPVHMEGIIPKIKTYEGKLAFVGLPCQTQSLRNIENQFLWLKEKIFIHIGLFCSGTKDKNALDYLLKVNNIKKNGITNFSYRTDGCLGNLKATYGTNGANYTFVPYVNAYSKLHSYFKPERCNSCIDHFSYLSDISVGDIDCEPYNEDKIGSNSLIARTNLGSEIVSNCIKENYLYANELKIEEIIRSQKVLNYRKQIFKANKVFNKILFKKNPVYDKEINQKLTIKGLIWLFSYKVQRFLSKWRFVK